jgi:hypothetical protein
MTYPVSFSFSHKNATSSAQLVGSFQSWALPGIPMQYNPDSGKLSVSVELPTGVHYFKFIINNEWSLVPEYIQVQDYSSNGAWNHCIVITKAGYCSGGNATVILGAKLRPDGSPEPHLRERVRVGVTHVPLKDNDFVIVSE